jgi:hypothetical protein
LRENLAVVLQNVLWFSGNIISNSDNRGPGRVDRREIRTTGFSEKLPDRFAAKVCELLRRLLSKGRNS